MKNFFLSTLLFLFSLVSVAQNATIRGFIYEKGSGEPVIFTNVYLEGTSLGAVTDVNGFFSITKIPTGDFTIKTSFLGFKEYSEKVSLKSNQILSLKIFLEKEAIEINTFDVSAERQEARTEVKMSVVKITPKEIEQIPTVGGDADLAQYLQVVPGVIFTGDQGGQLYIRGGAPIQNKVLLDGMVIYNPFHSIGLFSVFDTDVIRNADVYTGGFGAEYGGRISSIMDITTRDGNKNRVSGKLSVSPFQAKALLEGPLIKPKKLGGNSASYILSAKHSYLDQTSQTLYDYIDEDGLPFSFTDLYGKISFNGSNGSKINFFGFNFKDRVQYQAISNLNWDNWGVGSNFVLIPENSAVFVEGNFSLSSYEIEFQEGDDRNNLRRSGVDGFDFGLDFTYFMGDDKIKYGIEASGFATDFVFFNSLGREIKQNANTTELAAHVNYKFNKGRFVFDPSFRVHYYASLTEFSPEPRLGIKYNITENIRLKSATGLYSQNFISAVSDNDVVNLFYGFLSGPDNLPGQLTMQNGNTRDINSRLQKSTHAILGTEFDLSKRITLNVEGYYKWFTQLTNLNRDKIFEDTPANRERPDQFKKDFIVETGDAYGIDFSAKYDYKRLYIWAVYSLAYVTRWDGIREYFPVFDRRHNANFVSAYTFGKDLNWEFNMRWNLGSGFPFTPTLGYYENVNFNNNLSTDILTSNGNLSTQLGDLNSKRLTFYHRLDVNIKRVFYIGDNGVMEVNAGATNLYNRENIFYVERFTNRQVLQLPLMPSLGMNYKF